MDAKICIWFILREHGERFCFEVDVVHVCML